MNKLNNLRYFSIVTLIFFELIIFKMFRNNEKIEETKISDSISSLLRNELSVSNSYAMSKTLSDIESVGIFKCARLTEMIESNRIFYDTILGKRCKKLWLFDNTFKSIVLKGLNGTSYGLTFVMGRNKFAIYFEISLYILLIILGYFVPDFFIKRIQNEKLIVLALEFDKKKKKEEAEQISHDVASPLSAIKMLVSLVPSLNYEIKNLLIKSVDRTEEIFNALKKTHATNEKIYLDKCITELANEKHIIWGSKCTIQLNINTGEELVGKGNETAFKRAVSNLLNNSFDANQSSENSLIFVSINSLNNFLEIKIIDNGIGMTPDILSQLGSRGFSFGKAHNLDSGSGLGIHYSKSVLTSWGGDLNFESILGVGTTAFIKLKKFEL